MTQNMAVDQKKPSALPGMLLSTGVGAAAGFGLSKVKALQAPKYNSFADILKDSKDIFEAAGKEGATEEAKNLKNSVKDAMSNFYKSIKPTADAVRAGMTTEKTALAEAKTKFKDLWTKGVDEVVQKINKGDIKIEGLDTTKPNEVLKAARKHLRDNMTDELKTARTSLKEAANKFKFENLNFSEDQKKVLTEKTNDAWNSMKDKVKDIKVPRTGMMLAAGAGVGLLLGLLLKPKAKKEEA